MLKRRRDRWAGAGAWLLAAGLAACHRGAASSTGPALPPPLELAAATPRTWQLPTWQAHPRWSTTVAFAPGPAAPGGEAFCFPLQGGGLAYCDERGDGALLGPGGHALPAPWTEGRAGAQAGPAVDGAVWQGCRVARSPAGSLAVVEAGHLYRLDAAGNVAADVALPAAVGGGQLEALVYAAPPGPIGLCARDRQGRLLVATCAADGQAPQAHRAGLTCAAGDAVAMDADCLYLARIQQHKLDCYGYDGKRRWSCAQLSLDASETNMTPLAGGGLLLAGSGMLYRFDGQGRCAWRVALAPARPGNAWFAVAPADSVTLSRENALHFLHLDGTEAAPPLAMPPAGPAGPWSWCPNPSGGAFACVHPAAAGPCTIYAVSPAGLPLWQVEAPPDFALLGGTDTGLLYGLRNQAAAAATPAGDAGSSADVVCLLVVPPAG